jgi:pimeloyl-ACP methyl ester carboxylesterase
MTVAQSLKSIRSEKLTWNWRGHQVKYTVSGVGQPLLLIHGFGASIDHWRKNIPVLVEGGYQVYAIDLLGFGGSDRLQYGTVGRISRRLLARVYQATDGICR